MVCSMFLTLKEERHLFTKIEDYVIPEKASHKQYYQDNIVKKRKAGRDHYHAHTEECKARSKDRYKKHRTDILEQAKIRNPTQFQKNKPQIMARRIIVKGSKPTNNHVAISFEILNRLLVSKQQ